MEYYLILLRLIHIPTGVFWAGVATYLAFFILPAVKAAGPEGGKFMQQLSRTNKLPIVMMLMSTLNILSGVFLVERLSNGFGMAWITSAYGLTLTIGGVLALIAYFVGMAVNMPSGYL